MKYRNRRTEYNGVTYDSKKEAGYAQQLDWRIKAGEVLRWDPQHKIPIDVNGVHIANYFVDFKVWFPGGVEYHEVKGMETQVFKLKWKLVKALYPDHKFVLIK